jgi:hypothetical protein
MIRSKNIFLEIRQQEIKQEQEKLKRYERLKAQRNLCSYS